MFFLLFFRPFLSYVSIFLSCIWNVNLLFSSLHFLPPCLFRGTIHHIFTKRGKMTKRKGKKRRQQKLSILSLSLSLFSSSLHFNKEYYHSKQKIPPGKDWLLFLLLFVCILNKFLLFFFHVYLQSFCFWTWKKERERSLSFTSFLPLLMMNDDDDDWWWWWWWLCLWLIYIWVLIIAIFFVYLPMQRLDRSIDQYEWFIHKWIYYILMTYYLSISMSWKIHKFIDTSKTNIVILL